MTYKDTSFFLSPHFNENSFFDLVRDVAGDLVESVELVICNFCILTLHPLILRSTTLFIIQPFHNLTSHSVEYADSSQLLPSNTPPHSQLCLHFLSTVADDRIT